VRPWWYVVVVGLPVVLISVQGALFALLGHPLDLASIPGRLVNFLPSAIVLALIAGLGEEIGVGLIVTGSRGLGGMGRALMGSVSDSVVRHAHCPVMVVRPEKERTVEREGDFLT